MKTLSTCRQVTIRQSHLKHLEEDCPAMAWALAVEGRESPAGPEVLRGRAVHSFFSSYATRLFECCLARSDDERPRLLEAVLRSYPELSVAQRQEVEEQARNICRSFYVDPAHFVGTEITLGTDLPFSDELVVRITGTLDYLEIHPARGRALVVDLKSHYHLPPDSCVASDFQLSLYALLVLENVPEVEVVEGRLFYSRYGALLPQKGEALWTRTQADELKRHLAARLSAFFSGKLRHVKVPGDHCRYCPRRRIGDCSLYRSYYGTTPPAPRTERQAQKLARQVIALEEARETRLGLLKEYVKQNGPLAVGSGARCDVFSFSAKEQEEIAAADFLSVLLGSGIELSDEELSELLVLNRTSKLYKKLRSRSDLKEGLSRVAQRRLGSSVFGHRRPS